MKDFACAVLMVAAAVIVSGMSAVGSLYLCHVYGIGPVWEVLLCSATTIFTTAALITLFFDRGWM